MAKFGIEIECLLSPARAAEVISAIGGIEAYDFVCGYHHRRNFQVWRVERDSSVENGCEIVSPILDTEADGFEQIAKVTHALRQVGAGVNMACGLHVHLDARNINLAWMKNIIKRYSDNRTTIDCFMPSSRRRGGSRVGYCLDMSRFVSSARFSTPTTIENMISCSNRMYAVNITNHARLGTIEFRQHSGTLNTEKIQNWVTFLVDFVKASKPVETIAPRRNRPATRRSENRLYRFAGTPLPNILLHGREKRLWDALAGPRNLGEYHTLEALALASRYSTSSVRSAISVFRSYGMAVVNNRARGYICLNTPVASDSLCRGPFFYRREVRRMLQSNQTQNPCGEIPLQQSQPVELPGLWVGQSIEVQAYYQERIEDFQVNT